MSRGPQMSVGFTFAMPKALARGHVEEFRRQRGSTATWMISGGGILAIVLLRTADRLHASTADIAAEFRNAIALLRIHPWGGPVSRELWLYSRYGVLRYFRVEDDGLVEIGPDGKVLAAGPVLADANGVTCQACSRNKSGKKSGKKNPAMQGQLTASENPATPAPCGETPAAEQESVGKEGTGGSV